MLTASHGIFTIPSPTATPALVIEVVYTWKREREGERGEEGESEHKARRVKCEQQWMWMEHNNPIESNPTEIRNATENHHNHHHQHHSQWQEAGRGTLYMQYSHFKRNSNMQSSKIGE